ncbi:MAG: MFS transporter [Promethearchaeota archaeon]|nr:MAG: MFS transporter [Candidatus Lokiarchaeota archaeon]
MYNRIKKAYNEYPPAFRVLTLATFIDMLGSFLLYPFFALYITARFGVSMLEVGFLLSINSTGNIVGGFIGGALADKYGRRFIILFGLIVSGVGSIFMGLVDNLFMFYILAAILGLIGSVGFPARQAMVADLLPLEKQAKGFGILRISFNLSATIGPLLGGFLVTQSYLFLFIADAASSIITSIIVFLVIPETKPEKKEEEEEETVIQTLVGYIDVLKDGLFIAFCLISILEVVVYMQMNSTLSVYLRDNHGFPGPLFGILLSMNAFIVVLFQMWIANKIAKYDPMKMMAVGSIFYMIGFGMYGFVSEFYWFFIAMIIITIGEMIVSPVSQTAVAYFAPEDKRGRYMAMYGFTWTIPSTFGVILAALVIAFLGPNWVWYFAGILAFIASVGYWLLRKAAKDRFDEKKREEITNLNLNDNETSDFKEFN